MCARHSYLSIFPSERSHRAVIIGSFTLDFSNILHICIVSKPAQTLPFNSFKASGTLSPLPRCSPVVRFRESGLMQVVKTSPKIADSFMKESLHAPSDAAAL